MNHFIDKIICLTICLMLFAIQSQAFFVPTDPIISITINPNATGSTPVVIPVGDFYTARICAGTEVRLQASATGVGTLSYQWRETSSGSIINANSTFTAALAEGQYVVRVTDNTTTIQSTTTVQICISTAPPINLNISTSGTTTLCASGSPTNLILTANASEPTPSLFCSEPAFSYQWLKDNVAISGATNQTFAISNNASNAGIYTVNIANACGQNSTSITITVVPAPPSDLTISSNDGTNTVCPNGTLQLNANALGQVNAYEWYKIGTTSPIATGQSFAVNSTNTGNFRIRAINGCGFVESAIFNVSLLNPPTNVTISSDPFEAKVCEGNAVNLIADNIISGTLESVEWFRDGVSVINYQFPFATGIDYLAEQGGNYKVKLINKCGFIESLEQNVSIEDTPTFVEIVPEGPPSLSTTCVPPRTAIVLNAISDVPNTVDLAYEWYKDGNVIDGASDASYSAMEVGNYSVLVANACGAVTSAELVISETNVILPSNVTLSSNDIINSCTGSIALTTNDLGLGTAYLWQNNGNLISTTTLPTFLATESGSYTVKASNACGESNVSSNLNLTIGLSPDIPEIETPNGAFTCNAGTPIPLKVKPPFRTDVVYQWYKDGQIISGGIGTSYDANALGVYTVSASNTCGEETSLGVNVRYLTKPNINDLQIVINPCESPLILRVQTTANDLTYRWNLIDGITNPQVSTNESYQPTQSGAYVVSIRNACLPAEVWVSSQPFQVDLGVTSSLPTPIIQSEPSGIDRICPATFLQLKAIVPNTSTNLAYRWFRGSQLIVGENNNTIQVNQSGLYAVEIYAIESPTCSKVSASYSVYVRPVPTLLLGSNSSLEFCEGDSVKLRVNSQFTPQMYAWYKDDVFQGNGNTLTAKASGIYKVEATYNAGTLSFPCDFTTEQSIEIITIPNPTPQIAVEGGLFKSLNEGVTYQWNFNGIPILNALNPTHLPLDSGRYSLTITNELGCSGTSEELFSAGIYLEITEVLRISPNPNDGNFSITVVSEGVSNIALFNTLGQEIITQTELIKTNSIASYTKIQVRDLQMGIYLIKAQTDKGTISKKVIVR